MTVLSDLYGRISGTWRAANPNISKYLKQVQVVADAHEALILSLAEEMAGGFEDTRDALKRVEQRLTVLERPPAPGPAPSRSRFPWSSFDTPISADARVDADSPAVVANLARQQFMVQHDSYTTPVYYATASTPRVTITARKDTDYAQSEKKLTIPLDPAWRPSPGGDKHLCVIAEDGCEFDVWGLDLATRTCGTMNTIRPGSCDGWRPNGNGQRSGQNALTAGLILRAEAEAGLIPHALSFACDFRNGWATKPCKLKPPLSTVPIPRVYDGRIPEGARIRLDASLTDDNLRAFSRLESEHAILIALRDYGAFCVDGGGFGFYAEDAVSAGKWRDFPAGAWFLPPALKPRLQLLEYGAQGLHFHGGFNLAEHCPGSPVL